MPKFTYEEKLEHVRAFFRDYVNEYIVKDIQALMAIPVPESGGGACSAPLAMTVFSAMDLLGDLTRRGKESKSNDRTWANIKSFLDDWMSRADEIYEYLRLQEPLIGLFRKGAVHRFFPIGCGITRHKGYDSVFHGDDGCLILNVQAFASDFIDAIEELSKRVAEGQNKNLIDTIHEKLVGGIDDYRKTVQAQIPALVSKINPRPVPDFGRTEISGSLSGLDPEQLTASTTPTTTMTFKEMELTYTAPPPDWLK
jgi:hypothetical protein